MLDTRIVTRTTLAWIDVIGWLSLEKGDEIEIRSFRGDKVNCYFHKKLTVIEMNQFISNTTPKKVITVSDEEKRFRQLHLEQMMIGEDE